jgi:hypothetical protein
MACGSPILPNASHAALRTSNPHPAGLVRGVGWLAGRLSPPTPHTPPCEPTNPHPAGLVRGVGWLAGRRSYPTPHTPPREPTNPHPAGLGEGVGWLAGRLSPPTPHTPPCEPTNPHPAGLVRGVGWLAGRRSYPTPHTPPREPTKPHPAGLGEGAGWLAGRRSYPTPHTPPREPAILILRAWRRGGMACGSPILPNASHAALRTTYPHPAGLGEGVGWLAGRLSYPTPHTPPCEPTNPHPAGLGEVRDGLRVAYRPQRLTRRRANPPILILQGLCEGAGWLAGRLSPPTPHTPPRTHQSSSCRAWRGVGWLAGRLSPPTPHTPPREPTYPHPAGLVRGVGWLAGRLSPPTPHTPPREPPSLILQGLHEEWNHMASKSL